MLIEITEHRKKPISAVLYAVGLAAEPDENRKILVEFYLLSSLLELRKGDQVLAGHPLLDLQAQDSAGHPLVSVELLTISQAAKIRRQTAAGRLVAVGQKGERQVKRGQGKNWERAQWKVVTNRSRDRVPGRKQGFRFYYVDPVTVEALTEADLHWIHAICEGGVIYYEQLQAADAISQFSQALNRAAERDRKGAKKQANKACKRQRRRALGRGELVETYT